MVIVSVVAVILLGSCSANKKLVLSDTGWTYPGIVFLKNGEEKAGQVNLPSPADKAVYILGGDRSEAVPKTFINGDEIDRIVLAHPSTPDKAYTVRYLTLKLSLGRKADRWVICVAEGPYVSAYIGAENYGFDSGGDLKLIGTRQRINTGVGTTIIQPSYPVFMMKKDDKELTLVALTEGIQFEGSAFRSGVTHFLNDDPKLCEYIRYEKWGFENIDDIIAGYNPDRGNGNLVINGITIAPPEKKLLTGDLDKEMIIYVESAIPSDRNYTTQFGLGIRSSIYRFLAYGADLGVASAKYVDDIKRIENHPGNQWVDAPVIDADLSKQTLFRFNLFAGGQLPLDLKKVYLVPGAHIAFGGMFGTEYSTLYYGPMATLDLGFKLKDGSIFMIGGGYRRNIPLKSDEDKAEASAPGFEAYKPYENMLIRLSYKF
jgi:hypothetical protein